MVVKNRPISNGFTIKLWTLHGLAHWRGVISKMGGGVSFGNNVTCANRPVVNGWLASDVRERIFLATRESNSQPLRTLQRTFRSNGHDAIMSETYIMYYSRNIRQKKLLKMYTHFINMRLHLKTSKDNFYYNGIGFKCVLIDSVFKLKISFENRTCCIVIV